MDLDMLIVSMFCLVDDELKIAMRRMGVTRLRERGPTPTLSDAEVLTIELVGEMLGLACDARIYAYFRRHYLHFFPGLAHTCRTSFVRHSANLWHTKELIWQRVVSDLAITDESRHIVDSLPIPVCRFARAGFCRCFRGSARYGKDHSDRQTFYGLRLHVRLTWPGIISELTLAPANQSEQSVLPQLCDSAPSDCFILGDRNYCVPYLKDRLASDGQYLLTPPARQAKNDPEDQKGKKWIYSKTRYLIETVFGQLTDRFNIKNVWARDLWHLTNRIWRKVLAHTLCVIISTEQGNRPLQFDKLVQVAA